MTMDDFEFGVPMEGMDAMPEGLPEAALDVPGPAEDGAAKHRFRPCRRNFHKPS